MKVSSKTHKELKQKSTIFLHACEGYKQNY